MASSALGLAIISQDMTVLPIPLKLDQVLLEDGVLAIVEFDLAEYRRKHNSKAVKKR